MSRNQSQELERGQTLYNGASIDTANLLGGNLLGQTKDFEDNDWGSFESAKPSRSARKVRCMLVRNLSGVTLYGKRLVAMNPRTFEVSGYEITTAQKCYPSDEFLGSNGVPHGDVFWIVVSGPAIIKTMMTGWTADFVLDDLIVAGTHNAASTAAGTTGVPGRPDSNAITALTTAAQGLTVLKSARNAFTALSAATTGQTNADLLIDVGQPFNMF